MALFPEFEPTDEQIEEYLDLGGGDARDWAGRDAAIADLKAAHRVLVLLPRGSDARRRR